MPISSYWWNPRWEERYTLLTDLDPAACREAIDQNVGFFTPVAFDWFWPGRRWRFFKYTPLVGRGSRTWAFLNVASTTDGSEVTVRFALHPADIAGFVAYAIIYCAIVLVGLWQVGSGVATGTWHLTLKDDLLGLGIFVALPPLVLAGVYLSLRFIARKDGPFMLRVFKQILQAHEAQEFAGRPSRQEPSITH